MRAIHRSQLPKYLRHVATVITEAAGEETSESDVCRMAAKEIELLESIIINDPVELPIEEGDRANG